MKTLYKILSLFICLCLLITSVAGCSAFQGDISETKNTLDPLPIGSKTDEVTSHTDHLFHTPDNRPPQYYLYHTSYRFMFAKLKITQIYDDVYAYLGDTDFSDPYFLADVEVVEDYFKMCEKGTTLTLAIPLHYNNEETFQAMKSLLENSDYLYCQCYFYDGGSGENKFLAYMVPYSKREEEEAKIIQFQGTQMILEEMDFIPASDGKVSLSLLKNFVAQVAASGYKKFASKFEYYSEELKDFVCDGMPCEEFEAKIKHLYEVLK